MTVVGHRKIQPCVLSHDCLTSVVSLERHTLGIDRSLISLLGWIVIGSFAFISACVLYSFMEVGKDYSLVLKEALMNHT